MTLTHAGGAEDRDGRPPDPFDCFEPLQELFADARGVPGEVAVSAVEQAAVLHQSRFCGTWVPHMPSASSTASPTYMVRISAARPRPAPGSSVATPP